MCKVLKEIINSDPQLEVAGQARDGREAVALAETLKPDVITMDINMPHLDGLQATELIMSQNPRPIVIVSSESREGAAETLRALELGAIDFVPKPSSGIDLDMRNVREELTRKLKMAAKVRVVRTATRAKVELPAARPVAPAAPVSSRRSVIHRSKWKSNSGGRHRCVYGRSGGGDARGFWLAQEFAGGGVAGPAYAGCFHAAIYHAARRNIATAGERGGAQRNHAARHDLSLPRLAPLANFVHRKAQPRSRRPRSTGIVRARTWPWNRVAAHTRPATVAVVLTGMGNDAAKGVKVRQSRRRLCDRAG